MMEKIPMIDLHSHILPEVDDGAGNLWESLQMARIAVDSGVTEMVATPHCTRGRMKNIRSAWELLRDALEETRIPLKLHLGMEIFGTPDTARLLQEGQLLTLNGSRYPLVEFPFLSSGEDETKVLKELAAAGYQPVVAHPERYVYLQQEPEMINRWAEIGCLLQVNRGSLLGRFGERSRQLALGLIDRGFVTAVSSDCHSAKRRSPYMEDIRELLERMFSEKTPQQLLWHNPNMILQNRPLRPGKPEWF